MGRMATRCLKRECFSPEPTHLMDFNTYKERTGNHSVVHLVVHLEVNPPGVELGEGLGD